MSHYDRLGGEPALRAIIDDFIEREAADFIIGFFFQGKDLARVKEMEFQLASAHLGGPHRYMGRGMSEVHRRMPINKGHFRRRLAWLRKVLEEHEVDPEIVEAWLAHDARLEAMVTDGSDCVEER